MKLKCNDGLVRDFQICEPTSIGFTQSWCKHCMEEFGFHDTHILKLKFKKHSCKVKVKS